MAGSSFGCIEVVVWMIFSLHTIFSIPSRAKVAQGISMNCVPHLFAKKARAFRFAEKLSRERRSDDPAEQSLSHGSGRASSPLLAKIGSICGKNSASKKEPLAKACTTWLLMLH